MSISRPGPALVRARSKPPSCGIRTTQQAPARAGIRPCHSCGVLFARLSVETGAPKHSRSTVSDTQAIQHPRGRPTFYGVARSSCVTRAGRTWATFSSSSHGQANSSSLPARLRIDFLDRCRAPGDGTACVRAMCAEESVLIPDVITNRLFAAHRDIAASAGFRSVQSISLHQPRRLAETL